MIKVYTDGSHNPTTGRGGWAALLVDGDRYRVVSGEETRKGRSTNNRMELMAAIKGLDALTRWEPVGVTSDSQYLVYTMTRGWRRNANKDLWGQLDTLVEGRQVTWEWVKGHEEHPENEFVDAEADWRAGGRPQRPVPEDFLGHRAVTLVPAAESRPVRDDSDAPGARLTHLDPSGHARMVDVGEKPETSREAIATGAVSMRPETLALIQRGGIEKGDVLATARLAGIMGAKRTSDLIPLCHPIPISQIAVDLRVDEEQSAVHITATVRTVARTGVEMEAMTAVSTAALTIYDMCKAVERGMRIEGVRLLRKSGGRSGEIVLE